MSLNYINQEKPDTEELLYQEAPPFAKHHLDVGNGHVIYISEYGNPEGIPVFRVHGGPGSASKAGHTQIFNPEKYRIVLFDQRGCGMSTPMGSLENNTVWDLVEDLEKIRIFLSIEKFVLYGSSWGSTLALAYAQKYPNNISNLVLNALFLGSKREIDFCQRNIKKIFPDYYKRIYTNIPNEYEGRMLDFFEEKILNSPNPNKEIVRLLSFSEYFYLSFYPVVTNPEDINLEDIDEAFISGFKIYLYYNSNSYFLEEDELLFPKNIESLKNIPINLFAGRYDMICPIESSFMLYEKLDNSQLTIVNEAGHRQSDPYMIKELVKFFDNL